MYTSGHVGRKIPPIPDKRVESPEFQASWLSKLTFAWLSSLLWTGHKRPLEKNDLWTINRNRAVSPQANRLQKAFLGNIKVNRSMPLLRALHSTFWSEFYLGAAFQLVSNVGFAITPFVLQRLLSSLTASPMHSQNLAYHYVLVTIMSVLVLLQTFTMNHFMYLGGIVGGQARASLMSLIYQKSLRVKPEARFSGRQSQGAFGQHPVQPDNPLESPWTEGRITNLMSTDAFRVEQASMLFHMAWTAPVTIVITLVFLIVNIGYSALPGFAVLCVGIPSLMLLTKSLLSYRRRINKATDERITSIQEIFQNMRTVKLGGLEDMLLLRTNTIRKSEVSLIQRLLSFRMAITSASSSLPILASVFSFMTYALTHDQFEPAKVFATLSYFTVLRMPLNVLPIIAGQVTDAWASLERIDQFLRLEECQRPLTSDADSPLLQLNSATFRWPASKDLDSQTSDAGTAASIEPLMTSSFSLNHISIVLKRADFLGIAGPVASGKSTLLNALVGELEPITGSVLYNTTNIAWCPNQPWLLSTSIRENIILGKTLDEDWYQTVVFSCALLPDLQALQHGDQTTVGERGINLSGGQKQRISLARAVYSKPDIILMDDPLSALDSQTSALVYNRTIRGLLRDTCRVMATHRAEHLQHADQVVFLEAGQQVQNGHFVESFFQHTNEPSSSPTSSSEITANEQELQGILQNESLDTIVQEAKADKAVKLSVYTQYAAATGSFWNLLPVGGLLLLWEGSVIVTGLWLSFWSSQKFDLSQAQRIGIYTGLAISQAALLFLTSSVICLLGLAASRLLHNLALRRVIDAPMVFFETNPLGRIMNRFSKDVDSMDNSLTQGWRDMLLTFVSVTGVMALIIYYIPVFAPVLLPVIVAAILGAIYYKASARELKRYASIFRSKVFGCFADLTAGATAVRTYNVVDQFVHVFNEALDDMNSVEYLTLANQRWLTLRLDAVSSGIIFVVGCLAVSPKLNISASTTGLLLSYILGIVQQISYSAAQVAEVENDMVSTERLLQFITDTPQETSSGNSWLRHLSQGQKPGSLTLDAVQLRYRPSLPRVLDLTLAIPAGQHVAIVGPSGSGKSSLVAAITKLVDVSAGTILLDGVNIRDIPPKALRKAIAVIPQDVVLFSGTVRSNIYATAAQRQSSINDAVQDLQLSSAGLRLHDKVESGGGNFSTGQRQLIALARALVSRPKVLVLDESLSGVDYATNIEMQKTILRNFKDSTVLCIAHRLDGVFDYDRVLFIDGGRVIQDGNPNTLAKEDGPFYRLCREAGVASSVSR